MIVWWMNEESSRLVVWHRPSISGSTWSSGSQQESERRFLKRRLTEPGRLWIDMSAMRFNL